MRIGFDGKRAVNNVTGLGNYSRLVIETLGSTYPENSMLIYTPKLGDNPRLKTIYQLPNATFITPDSRLPWRRGSLWRSFDVSRRMRNDGLNIYHGLSNELPLNIAKAGIPSIVTIHDLIYLRRPDDYSPIDRKLYDFKYRKAAENATRIIAISQRTSTDLTELYGIDPDKIDLLYQGCDDQFKRQCSAEEIHALRRRLKLPQRYLLQVGTIEPRKNLELGIRALQALPSWLNLVALGSSRLGYKEKMQKLAQELGVANRVHFLQGVPFSDLPALNQGADIVLYPSFYEGFGIPILEGLESRKPVIAATGSCLEEAGGPASIYVDPTSPRQMAEAINGLLKRDNSEQIALGLKHAARFSNSEIAPRLIQIYRNTISQYRPR